MPKSVSKLDQVGWRRINWRHVLFTDESRYCLDYTDRRVRVWRRPGERFHAANIAEHDRYGGGSIMVWGGISWDGRTDLVVLNQGTLTAQRYRDEILDTQVRLYAGAAGDQFILTDDNARPHTAHIVQRYLFVCLFCWVYHRTNSISVIWRRPAITGGGRPQPSGIFSSRRGTWVEPSTFRKPAGWLPHI